MTFNFNVPARVTVSIDNLEGQVEQALETGLSRTETPATRVEVEEERPQQRQGKAPAPPAGGLALGVPQVLAAYENNDPNDPYRIVDFRPVKEGDYFLQRDLQVKQAKRGWRALGQPRLILQKVR